MAKLFNRAKMTTATTGSGTVTLGSASNGFQTFAAAGVSNGDVVQYVIEEGANFEIGTGTYSSSGTSLTRSPTESSNSDNAITLAGQATVSITAVADDLNRLQHGGSDKVTVSSTGASVTGNLAVSGTVDGRDVASDGSKLDGIESGATGDQTNAEIRAAVEAATDSNVFTDADHTKLNGIEANAKNDQTITAGGGLTGGGTGDVTLSHSDTSSVVSTDNSGNTFVQDLTFDTYGHVTAVGTGSVSVGNGTLTVQGTGALGGSGTFTANQSGNTTISISHDDTSSQASVNNSGRTYIQDITLDTYGHITGITSATETVVNTDTNTTNFNVQANGGTQVNISAGEEINFINGNATTAAVTNQANPTVTFHHNDTSSQGSVNNSGGTVIQDVTLDGYGHVTGLTSYNLDGRYFTESESDGRFVRKGVGYIWTAVGGNALSFRSNDTIDTASGDQAALEIYQDNAGHDAFIQFHVAGDYGKYLGLHGGINDFVVGGWSHGASYQRLFHDGYHPNADTLTTARTINGVSFNGSANITIADSTKLPLSGGTVTGDVQFNSGANIHRGTHSSGYLVGSYNNVGANSAKSNPIYTIGSGYQPNDTDLASMYGIGYSHGNANFDGINTVLSDWGLYVAANGTARIGLDGGNGNIKLTGTVDGRDVAADGTKLDTIATNANNYSFPYTVSASASNSTVVQRHSSGYIFANYFNTTPNDVSSGVTKICCETGNDGYIRHATAAAVRSFINVADGANNITNNNQLTNGAGYTTFTANQSLNTSSNPTFNQIYANDWFRVNGADGIYWQSYAGGWYMTDTSWMRVYNNKGIYTSGEIQGGTINTPSDINLKKDIVKIDDALDKLHQLNGYNFTFKATDKKSSGVIAQEVQKVMPQLVHEGADEGTLTVEYGNMVGLLIEAIKEQQTQIDDLKAEIQSMKS